MGNTRILSGAIDSIRKGNYQQITKSEVGKLQFQNHRQVFLATLTLTLHCLKLVKYYTAVIDFIYFVNNKGANELKHR